MVPDLGAKPPAPVFLTDDSAYPGFMDCIEHTIQPTHENFMTTRQWPTREQVLEMGASFMPSCVLGAAAELDLFTLLDDESLTVEQIAGRLKSDPRATRMLLDAVTSLDLLDKQGDLYSVPPELRPLLNLHNPETVLPMVLHRMNILRGWAQLAWVAKAGIPGPRQASIRGPAADREAFVAAMHTVSRPNADPLVGKLQPLEFRRLLDVGGASGTWTMAFLKAAPDSTATIFDLPDAIKQARDRFAHSELAGRVTFVPGDFYADRLPAGCDLAWVSAIIHQHSRRHNRELFAKVFEALEPGGRIAIRDVVMDSDRVHPVEGALFAINMLVNTDEGGTFTFDEIAEDLQAAGFVDPDLKVRSEDMNSVVTARKP